MKIRPVRAELFRVDRRTDGQTERHDDANSRFSPHDYESASKLAKKKI